MYQKKRHVIFTLVAMFLLSISLNVMATEEWSQANGASVESIYQSIRYAAPRYVGQETVVSFENEGMTVVCSLTVPNTPHKAPIVITLNGFSGTRDEALVAGTDEGILKRNARILAEVGIATLRVDFRGAGDSDGEYDFTSFSDQVSDALAAIKYIQRNLKQQVDVNSIGMIGFSQGGLVSSVTGSKSKEVDSIVLWSAPAYPPYDYEGLLTRAGVQKGVALAEGESAIFPLSLNGQPLGIDVFLGKKFFVDLFSVMPTVAISEFKKPMMYIAGLTDAIVWPQPAIGNTFLKYHEGPEKLVEIEGDHAFNYWDATSHEKLDDAIYWSAAWMIKTLK